MEQQLTRSESDRMIAGICGGLAAYLNIDPVFVRLAFVVLTLASGIGLAIYLILWLVMPSESQDLASAIIINEKSVNEETLNDPASLKSHGKPAATVGFVLVLFGGFFLLSQLGWLSNAFWPLALVGAGLYFILRRTR
ncbi:MAG: PspC domain-containing protein [Chloroflexota bacterium]